MFKAMILLKRKAGTSRDDFAKWLLEQHRPLAETLPGLKRSVFNLVSHDGPEICDGISELWFESKADFDAAYATDIGKAVAADSIANVSERTRLFVDEVIVKA